MIKVLKQVLALPVLLVGLMFCFAFLMFTRPITLWKWIISGDDSFLRDDKC